MVVVKEIRRYQRSSFLLLRKQPFQRLVREITTEVVSNNAHFRSLQQFRIQASALEALQDGCEAFLTHYFSALNILAIHAKRVTIMPRDNWTLKHISSIPLGNGAKVFQRFGQ